MNHRSYAWTLLALVALTPCALSAHGVGASFEKQSGAYLVDVGYDPAPPEAGSATLFDFELLKIADNTPAPYSHVWVRILDEGETMLASGIYRQDIGATTLLFTFPEEGTYTLEASYRGDDGEIASASFSVPVVAESGTPLSEAPWFLPALFFLGVCTGVAVLLFLQVRTVGKSEETGL